MNKRVEKDEWRVHGWVELGSIRWETASGKCRDENFLLE